MLAIDLYRKVSKIWTFEGKQDKDMEMSTMNSKTGTSMLVREASGPFPIVMGRCHTAGLFLASILEVTDSK